MGNKIYELLMKQGQVSLQKDVLPLALDEFEDVPMNDSMYEMACEFIQQQLCAVHVSGCQLICYPVFSGEPRSGALSVVDMIWKKM